MKNIKKIVSNFKNRVQYFKINFKKKFKEYKEKPKSKRKSFIIGFTTAVGIFGLILFGPALSAVAKDIPKGTPKPTDIAAPATNIAPAPTAPPTPVSIRNGLFLVTLPSFAGTVCAIAVSSGSFAVGVACGFVAVASVMCFRKIIP